MKSYLFSLAICLSFGLISSALASSLPVTHGKDAIFEKASFSNSSQMLKLAGMPLKQGSQPQQAKQAKQAKQR